MFFLDSLKIVWSWGKALLNIVTAPLALFFNFEMPFFVGLMIGVPYFIMLLLCVIAFFRGASD